MCVCVLTFESVTFFQGSSKLGSSKLGSSKSPDVV